MLMQLTDLLGFSVSAEGEIIGKISDLLFDKSERNLKFFDVESNSWFHKRRVLLEVDKVSEVIWSQETVSINIAPEDVEKQPGLMDHLTASRDHLRVVESFKWPQYAIGNRYSFQLLFPLDSGEKGDLPQPEIFQESLFSNSLYSLYETVGFELNAKGSRFGSVRDIIVNAESYIIEYLSVYSRRWLPGNTHFIPWELIDDIELTLGQVIINSSMDQIKSSPHMIASKFVSRKDEKNIYDHYHLTPYWMDKRAINTKRSVS